MMRNQAIRVLSMLALFLAVAAGAYAQDKVSADVPFEFAVGGKTLPAGTYTIGRASANRPGMLLLHGEDGNGNVVYAPADFDGREAGTKLVFHRYGNHYFLRAVQTGQGRYQLGESKQEMHVARGGEPDTVAMATRGR